ncbi:hypothetical protein HDU98_010932 [Podochytrium sp. JEL0797]|nr:hypothetical protein HDU98_010932 [Podochytrium sp. JEL0797]
MSATTRASKAVPRHLNPSFVLTALEVLWTQGVDPFTASSYAQRHLERDPLLTPPLSPVECAALPLREQSHLVRHVARLLSPQTMSKEVVNLALLLVSRLRMLNKNDAVRKGAEQPLLSTAILIALKTLDDWRIDSVAWVPYCKLELSVINAMEREFLVKIQWHVNVTRREYELFDHFLNFLNDAFVSPPVFSTYSSKKFPPFQPSHHVPTKRRASFGGSSSTSAPDPIYMVPNVVSSASMRHLPNVSATTAAYHLQTYNMHQPQPQYHHHVAANTLAHLNKAVYHPVGVNDGVCPGDPYYPPAQQHPSSVTQDVDRRTTRSVHKQYVSNP